MFDLRFVSVLGDSISTYSGFNPIGYHVFYDDERQQKNGMESVYDTWWAKVNQFLMAYLCVNNSYSGSRVSGNGFPSASCSQRTALLHTEHCYPDIILIYIGYNDFGNGVKIKAGIFERKRENYFYDSYIEMLHKIKKYYPKSTIVCGTLMKGFIKDNLFWQFPDTWAGIAFEEYNKAIRKAAKKEKVRIADLALLNRRYETLDGTHPTVNGHETIARAWIDCLSK